MTDLSPRTGPSTSTEAVRRRRNWLPMIVLGLVLVAGGVIVTQFLRSAVDYYCNVDEVGARSGCDADRRLRLQGVVERGSIESAGGDTDFVISFNGSEVPVRYDGEPGGIFKECIPVVVHGRFDSASQRFLGDRVEVRHSDEYVSVNDARLTEADELADSCESA
ncbi:MAG: cytochrome c maturation protein CcmE [Ilumatobacter sp.]|uniref:cytochrome c maturation protein CcmE n=1 Tax=Ilumatobacter sp. TaxID=1967498 RepID=UPI00261E25EC|nr:cytochrome c maturation protein CcmE [Ilumatobacter sp.]MDJ0771152.1 cytochrome c maturation protein CcmE [Ilumatobacter sp.]